MKKIKVPRLNEIISMRLNYEDSEKLEELADEYGLKVSTYCRAILKAHLHDKYIE